MRSITQQLRQVWQGLSGGQRVALVLAALIAVGLVLGVGYWASQPDFRVLYAGLSEEDAGAVIARLQNQGISYRLAAGGTTVLVPAEKVQQARVELAVEGLPAKGGKGFELFDQSPLGMTPFTQHVNYLRALQAELSKTIMQIEPVVYARVHVVRPEPSPFVREQKPTTASVMLKLRAGAALGRNIAAGIVALVSRSVEGLARENVTLVDANGRLLWEEQDREGGPLGSHLEYRRELESYLASKAESMLAQVLGPGRAIVRVTADLNMKHHKERKETYSPDARAITSEKISSTKSTSGSPTPRGTPGTATNLGKPVTSGNGGTNNQEETSQTDFASSKIVQEDEHKMGAIERLTIAALVDLTPPKDKEGEAKATMKLADAQEIIKQAVGFKQDRDEIKVSDVALPGHAPTAGEDALAPMQTWQYVLSLVRHASLAISALTALLLCWMLLRRIVPRAPAAATAAPAAQESDAVSLRLANVLEKDPEALSRVLAKWLDQPPSTTRRAA